MCFTGPMDKIFTMSGLAKNCTGRVCHESMSTRPWEKWGGMNKITCELVLLKLLTCRLFGADIGKRADRSVVPGWWLGALAVKAITAASAGVGHRRRPVTRRHGVSFRRLAEGDTQNWSQKSFTPEYGMPFLLEVHRWLSTGQLLPYAQSIFNLDFNLTIPTEGNVNVNLGPGLGIPRNRRFLAKQLAESDYSWNEDKRIETAAVWARDKWQDRRNAKR